MNDAMVRDERRQIVYDAVLYGLSATLAELGNTPIGARLAEQIHLEFGRHFIRVSQDQGSEVVVGGAAGEDCRVYPESIP